MSDRLGWNLPASYTNSQHGHLRRVILQNAFLVPASELDNGGVAWLIADVQRHDVVSDQLLLLKLTHEVFLYGYLVSRIWQESDEASSLCVEGYRRRSDPI